MNELTSLQSKQLPESLQTELRKTNAGDPYIKDFPEQPQGMEKVYFGDQQKDVNLNKKGYTLLSDVSSEEIPSSLVKYPDLLYQNYGDADSLKPWQIVYDPNRVELEKVLVARPERSSVNIIQGRLEQEGWHIIKESSTTLDYLFFVRYKALESKNEDKIRRWFTNLFKSR